MCTACMQFEGHLKCLDCYYIERRELQTQNGRLHAEIWRLGKVPGSETLIADYRREINDNTRHMRRIDWLISKIHLSISPKAQE